MNLRRTCTALALALLPATAGHASTYVAATTTDYGASGRVSTCTTHSPWSTAIDVATVASDAQIRYFGGLFYVVNRFGGDNIQVLDPASGFATLRQFSVGAGSNPYDIAFWSKYKAYVSRYDKDSLWVVNPANGAHLKSISLAPFADADGIPEMDHMIILGGKLFVSLQRLDRNNFYSTTGPSRIAVIDVAGDTLLDVDPGTPGVQAIVLTGANPVTSLEWNLSDRKFYLGEVGEYGLTDGGIEAVDPATYQVSGFLVTEDSLGGDVSVVRLGSATQGYAIISDANFNTQLVRFDAATHRKFATPFPAAGFVLSDCVIDDIGRLWLSDRTSSDPGLRLFSAATGTQLTSAPINVGLPPASLAVDMNGATGVDGVPRTVGALSLQSRCSNPVRGAVEFSLESSVRARVAVLDVSGRRVRELSATDGVTSQVMRWDGCDASGGATPAGIYWIVAESPGARRALRIVKL